VDFENSACLVCGASDPNHIIPQILTKILELKGQKNLILNDGNGRRVHDRLNRAPEANERRRNAFRGGRTPRKVECQKWCDQTEVPPDGDTHLFDRLIRILQWSDRAVLVILVKLTPPGRRYRKTAPGDP
jgi:hypothetical protein